MKYFTACFLLLLAFAVSGEEAKVPHVTIQTSFGPIEIELNPVKAPESVETFLTYVKEGFYEGTIFHRVINNFVVQGGGYTADFKKKDTHPSIPNEAANGLKNLRGTVALARSNDPHSANSQFFVNVRDNKFLDYKSSTAAGWGYCVFGKVIEGMEVVDKIAKTPTDSGGPFKRDVPQTTITIDAVKVEYVAPTDWVTSAGGPDKPATEKKPTSEEKKKSEPSMADMQQDMLSMDMEEDGKSPAAKDKSESASSSKTTGDKSPQEAKPATKAIDQSDDQAKADDQAADPKGGKVATPVDAKTKVHHEAKTDKKPVTEKQEKVTPAGAAVPPEEKSSMDTEGEENEPAATASAANKIPAGTDQKSDAKMGKEATAATTEAQVATPVDAKTKIHHEANTDKKTVPEKKEKPGAVEMQPKERSSMDTEEANSEPATTSEKKIPAGTDKKPDAKTGKEAKAHNEAKTGHKPMPEKHQDKPKMAVADDTQEEDISSKDTEEEDREPATASAKKKIPVGSDKKSSDAKDTKIAKDSKAAHNEAKTGLKPILEKQEKPKTAVADDTQEEDTSSTEKEDREPATASAKKKIPAETDKKSSDANIAKESKVHNEAKTGLKPVPGKPGKPKADDTQEEDISSKDTEEADNEPATASEKKKVPGAGTDKKSSDAKTGKDSKATIEKKPPTVTRVNEKNTSELTALEEETAPKGVAKPEHSAKITPDESSSKKMLKEDSAAKSKQEKDTPTATTQSSPNQLSTKAELEKKAVASIEAQTEEKTRVKSGEKASVGKSGGKTTLPPDSPTPPDKPEPVAY